MKLDKRAMLLYAVTDRAWVGEMSLYEQVKATLDNGATCVQIREKEMNDEDFLAEAIELRELCDKYNVPLVVNDNISVAIKCKAPAIHIGQDDMKLSEVRELVGDDVAIGVSAHDVEEALDAERNGADYLGAGAVFSTSTKHDIDLMPFDTLKAICEAVSIPVVAIGGITRNNIMELAGTGVDGVAVVSAIFGAKDPGKATAELLKLSTKMVAK